MDNDSYAPPLGINRFTPPVDPDAVNAWALALQMHEGRYLVVPRIKQVAQPNAGADWNIQVPGGFSWILLSINANFTTSVTVSTRLPSLTLSDGTSVFMRIASAGNATASQAARFSFTRAVGPPNGGVQFPSAEGSVPMFTLWSGLTIASLTGNLDAADQWSSIFMSVLEIRERTPNERIQYAEALLSGNPTTDTPGLLFGL